MMSLGFATPLFLLALLALPAIWWLLRLTPPKPQIEIFPPLKLLLQLTHKDETPSQSPWWLILLRLLIAALVIFALAQPVWKPQTSVIAANHPLALVIDNGWASAADWKKHMHEARALVQEAENGNTPIYIITTAEETDNRTAPLTGEAARRYLDSLSPHATAVDRKAAFTRLAGIARQTPDLQIIYLTDGLATTADTEAFGLLASIPISHFLWYQGDISTLAGLCHAENTADKLSVTGVRADTASTETWQVTARDREGHSLGESRMVFANGEKNSTANMDLPLEIRNDVASFQLEGVKNAGATWLMNTGNRRRRIAILAPATGELAQPLLSPLYYVSRALAPYGNIIHADPGGLAQNIDILLGFKPAVLIMGDMSGISADVNKKLAEWISNGGTLIRFAGPNLAASAEEDTLIPVTLRRGERTLGGAMSWANPQKIAPFPETGPFAGLTPPDDVTVLRQILAEPSATLYEKSWVTLADGTPLVTAATEGKGRIVFIHTTADPSWSNLPLSGFFVEMLQRIVTITSQPVTDSAPEAGQALPPWRTIAPEGGLETPPGYVKPLVIIHGGQSPVPTFSTPPGLYGTHETLHALNLLDENTKFSSLQRPASIPVREMPYTNGGSFTLDGLLWAAAVLLFALDSLIALRPGGLFPRSLFQWNRKALNTSLAVISASVAVFLSGMFSQPIHAQESKNTNRSIPVSDETDAAVRAGKTHLAYVITRNDEIDKISKAGLESLSQFITQRTTINSGEVISLDLEKDELAFYPLIYWPIDPDSSMPSPQAIERIDTYMHQGGTILFDTRDQITANLRLDNKASPATQYLRKILSGLNIPPLEPAPPEHVIARSFFIMPDFPGRYRDSALWIASTPEADNDNRPIRAGDGVSPILITANDLAGAWAHDGKGNWLFPLVPDDNMQRVWAFRGGLNIVMYMLSGNYKADQIHAPELLKRLGR